MIVFKCKMCGGEMELEEGATVAECPYCMTKQTLPKLDNDKRANMYDRANHFRRQNEYDKAMAIFESILQEDRTDAEAYWSLVLCRYGIEYVEDPATRKRVPTVNRVQYTSILADEDYKSALEYADMAQRSVYEAEAKAIDEIQKGILEISKQETPFDVFICYKETDANGRRTPDSVLATDLYHQLTKEGFKVFFSRITLEDKIGSAYEPYIFAALNSAKVMVVLGTKPEYFNAVWVKNEWSRYLALIRAGADKTLVPAYRDMDPYDLPDEFSHLQAQDMGKLGFMQDLIRGIKKLTDKEAAKPQTVVQQSVGTGANVENLMKRVRLFLEDSNFSSADEYLDRVLDENAEYAPAYIGKVLIRQKLHREEELGTTLLQYEQDPNWTKALRFASPEQRKKYEDYLESSKKARLEKSLSDQYNAALAALSAATDEQGCYQAKKQFMQISSYKDSQARMEECDKKALRIAYDRAENKRLAVMRQIKSVAAAKELESIAPEFEKLGSYSDASSKAQLCRNSAVSMREAIYDAATEKLERAETVSDVEAAEKLFIELGIGYKNASGKLTECKKKKELLKQYETLETRRNNLDRQKASVSLAKQYDSLAKEYQALEGNSFRCNACLAKADKVRATLYEDALKQMQAAKTKYDYEKASAAFKELEAYKDSPAKAQECLNAIDSMKRAEEQAAKREKAKKTRTGIIITLAVLLIVAGIVVATTIIIPGNHYKTGEEAFAKGEYSEAYKAFCDAGNYKDASDRAKESIIAQGETEFAAGNYEEAYNAFKTAGDYGSAQSRAKESARLLAEQLFTKGEYESAGEWYMIAEDSDGYKKLGDYYLANRQYGKAASWYERIEGNQDAQLLRVYSSAVSSDEILNHDTQDTPVILPDNVYLYKRTQSSGSKKNSSTSTSYGVFKIGEGGWATDGKYSSVVYYEKYGFILLSGSNGCAIIDVKNNRVKVVEDATQLVSMTSEAICYKNTENLYGFLNLSGDVLVQPTFKSAKNMNCGLAPVKQDSLWGYVGSNGKVVIDYKFKTAEAFTEQGYAVVDIGSHQEKENDIFVDYNYGNGIINTSGEYIVYPKWYEIDLSETYSSHYLAKVSLSYKNQLGLVSIKDGHMVLEAEYSTIGEFFDGLALVRKLKEGESHYPCTKAGYIDYNGKMVVNLISMGIDGPLDYESKFINGFTVLSVWVSGGYIRDIKDVLIDSKGTIYTVNEVKYGDGRQYDNGDIYFEGALFDTSSGSLVQKKDNSTSSKSESAFMQQWEYVYSFSDEGLAKVSMKKKGSSKNYIYGYITKEEKILVDPIFSEAYDFTNGYASVCLDGKWGFINASGTYVIEPQYSGSYHYVNESHTIIVKDSDGYKLINMEGKTIISGISDVCMCSDREPLSGIIGIKKDGAWQLIDITGNRIF